MYILLEVLNMDTVAVKKWGNSQGIRIPKTVLNQLDMHISDEQALGYFYSTKTFKQLNDPKYGLQLMSDEYLLEDIQKELSLR